ncbi:hypothetical protein WUBG_00044 [Wuchereria bancrofti]|uniref:Uncharacterized protein n=1 Tax=Wuchereria bancrofti TaxID=6293 RepID=J9F2E5_WUCBA|nr:hypothetical protein WUBG_00044 [Wuchereria bancrofti]
MTSTVHFCPRSQVDTLSKRTIKRYRRRIPSSHHSGGNAKRVNGLLVLLKERVMYYYTPILCRTPLAYSKKRCKKEDKKDGNRGMTAGVVMKWEKYGSMGYRPLCAINTDYYPEHLLD